MTTDYTELDTKIALLGLDYSATFVPFSRSRNAKPDPKISDLSLNWRVTLRNKLGAATLETDYMQGIGHLPEPLKFQKTSYTIVEADAIRNACEHGKYPLRLSVVGSLRPLPVPLLRDVLHSLVMDASALDHPTFESWAADFGYETDSRKAEQIYRACLELALKLRAMVGDGSLAALREAFQDY